MSNDRSPIQLLCDILDEVEGLRRTDARSYLPLPLMLKIHDAVDGMSGPMRASSTGIHDICDLEGQTIAHVFESLSYGDTALVCTDGSFIILQAEADGVDAYIRTVHSQGKTLAEYVKRSDLVRAGMMAKVEADRLDREEKLAELERKRKRLEMMRADLARAEAEIGGAGPQ